jgi:hypothetical protein
MLALYHLVYCRYTGSLIEERIDEMHCGTIVRNKGLLCLLQALRAGSHTTQVCGSFVCVAHHGSAEAICIMRRPWQSKCTVAGDVQVLATLTLAAVINGQHNHVEALLECEGVDMIRRLLGGTRGLLRQSMLQLTATLLKDSTGARAYTTTGGLQSLMDIDTQTCSEAEYLLFLTCLEHICWHRVLHTSLPMTEITVGKRGFAPHGAGT